MTDHTNISLLDKLRLYLAQFLRYSNSKMLVGRKLPIILSKLRVPGYYADSLTSQLPLRTRIQARNLRQSVFIFSSFSS